MRIPLTSIRSAAETAGSPAPLETTRRGRVGFAAGALKSGSCGCLKMPLVQMGRPLRYVRRPVVESLVIRLRVRGRSRRGSDEYNDTGMPLARARLGRLRPGGDALATQAAQDDFDGHPAREAAGAP